MFGRHGIGKKDKEGPSKYKNSEIIVRTRPKINHINGSDDHNTINKLQDRITYLEAVVLELQNRLTKLESKPSEVTPITKLTSVTLPTPGTILGNGIGH